MESKWHRKGIQKQPGDQMSREIFVGFADNKIKDAYQALKEGKGAEPHLYEFLSRAFDDLKKDPFCGIKIEKKLWPKEYIRKYEVDNLWKYDLPGRLENDLHHKSESGNYPHSCLGMV